MNYAQILSGLFVGSHPRVIDDVERLREESAITAVLNLQTDEDMRSVKLNWPPLEAHYQTCGVDLLRLPVKEEQIELREKLPECVRSLASLITAGRPVYLHCTEGVGRSPTVAIGYLHWCLGWELDAAVSHVKQARHCSPHLEALRLAVWNPTERANGGEHLAHHKRGVKPFVGWETCALPARPVHQVAGGSGHKGSRRLRSNKKGPCGRRGTLQEQQHSQNLIQRRYANETPDAT